MGAQQIADAAGVPYEPPQARLRAVFRKEGESYITDFPGLCVELTRVETAKSETYGLIRVTSSTPGLPALLHQGRFNLTSTNARASLVKYLGQRDGQTDWAEVIEQVAMYVLESMREGQPVVRITDVLPRQQGRYRVAPLVVEGFPTIIFGPGGSGKSQLGALLSMAVHGDDGKGWDLCDLDINPGPVLVCDWELDGVSYKEMCDPIAQGMGIPLANFHYRQCMSPLYEEAQAIGRFIDREGIKMVVCDSLGYAIGGDKTSQELTMRMFSAIRAWGISTLCIDHITNDEANGNRPYGSVYTVNSARSLWRVRASQEEGAAELSVGLFQTKANFGKQPPVGFLFRFSDGETSIQRQDVREVEGFQENLSLSSRIKTALQLAREALTVAQLVEAMGLTAEQGKQVRPRLHDMRKNFIVVEVLSNGTGLAAKWALASSRDGDGT